MSSAAEIFAILPTLPEAEQQVILNGPALAPPEGQIPQLENPPNGNDLALIVLICGIVPVVLLGGLRLYARLWVSKVFRIEDWIGFAAIFPFCAGAWKYHEFLEVGGYLTHQWDMSLKSFLGMLQVLVHLRVCHGLVMLLSKTAIVIEWTRIFVPHGVRNWFYWASTTVLVLNTIIYAASLLIIPVACIPTNKIWQPWVDGRCIDRKVSDIVSAWFNLVADIVLLILPQTVIWKLRMPRASKIGVSLMFSIGILVAVAAAARIWSNTSIDYSGDTAYDASIVTMVSWAELVGVMVVFFATGTPLAFAKITASCGRVASMRPWVKIQGASARKKGSTEDRSWVDSRRSRHFKESGETTELGFVRTEIQASPGHEGDIYMGPGFKTVTVQRKEEYVPYASTEQFLPRQGTTNYGEVNPIPPYGDANQVPMYGDVNQGKYGGDANHGNYGGDVSQGKYGGDGSRPQ